MYNISSDITVINDNVSGDDQDLIHDMQFIRITDTIAQADSDRFIANRLTVTIEQGQDPRVTDIDLNRQVSIITEDIFHPPYQNHQPIVTEWGVPIILEGGSDSVSSTLPYQPHVDLSISTDGASTWSNTVSYPMNQIGFRKNIMNWNRLGACNTITFKFRFWGQSRFVVSNAILEVK